MNCPCATPLSVPGFSVKTGRFPQELKREGRIPTSGTKAGRKDSHHWDKAAHPPLYTLWRMYTHRCTHCDGCTPTVINLMEERYPPLYTSGKRDTHRCTHWGRHTHRCTHWGRHTHRYIHQVRDTHRYTTRWEIPPCSELKRENVPCSELKREDYALFWAQKGWICLSGPMKEEGICLSGPMKEGDLSIKRAKRRRFWA